MCLIYNLFYFVLRGNNLYQRSELCLSSRFWKTGTWTLAKVTPRRAGSRVSWESPQNLTGLICKSMSWLSLCPEISVPHSTLAGPITERAFSTFEGGLSLPQVQFSLCWVPLGVTSAWTSDHKLTTEPVCPDCCLLAAQRLNESESLPSVTMLFIFSSFTNCGWVLTAGRQAPRVCPKQLLPRAFLTAERRRAGRKELPSAQTSRSAAPSAPSLLIIVP